MGKRSRKRLTRSAYTLSQDDIDRLLRCLNFSRRVAAICIRIPGRRTRREKRRAA